MTGEEKAAAAEVRINQIETSEFPKVTGKRVGSYFFRTSDEIKQVHDFYEDKMTRATWDVSRAPTQVWGSSEAEGRKFEVTPERRGDDTRVRVAFEEKNRK